MNQTLLLLLLAIGMLVVPAPARAQQQAAAEALFRSAQEAAESGDWQAACDRFEESNRLERAPGTVLNLARCRENLGQLAQSWKRYSEAAELLKSDDARGRYALRKRDELEPRLPKLTLLPPAEEGIIVELAGVQVSPASYSIPLPMDPGKVKVTVSAEGRELWIAQLTLAEGESRELQLELGPELTTEVAPQALAETPDSSSSRRTWGWTSIAVGGAGAAVGVAGGIWALVELSAVNAHCSEGQCDSDGIAASDRGQTANILLGAGLGAAAVGLTTGILLLRGESSPKTPPRAADVALIPLEGGAFLSFRGEL